MRTRTHPPPSRKLAAHFFTAFPQLEGVSFTPRWGGVIDTCSRFCAFFGTAHGGRLAYVAGYTGLGVGATRFGAQVLLDKIDNLDTERTRLTLVRSKPIPFPPEPVRSGVIQLTRSSIARADENEGRRDAWLRLLDRVGLGFDSLGLGPLRHGHHRSFRNDLTRVAWTRKVHLAPRGRERHGVA